MIRCFGPPRIWHSLFALKAVHYWISLLNLRRSVAACQQ